MTTTVTTIINNLDNSYSGSLRLTIHSSLLELLQGFSINMFNLNSQHIAPIQKEYELAWKHFLNIETKEIQICTDFITKGTFSQTPQLRHYPRNFQSYDLVQLR